MFVEFSTQIYSKSKNQKKNELMDALRNEPWQASDDEKEFIKNLKRGYGERLNFRYFTLKLLNGFFSFSRLNL